MKASRKSLVLTAVLALGSGTVAAMNGGTIISGPAIATTGAVYIQTPAGKCSGTLMSATWVLTARHCVVPKAPGFGNGEDQAAAPDGSAAGFADALYTTGPAPHYLAVGWSAPYGSNDLTKRRALVASYMGDGWGRDPDYGDDGYASISFTGPAITLTELNDVIPVPASADVLAVGRAIVNGTSYMLVSRFSSVGDLTAAPWATSNPGATIGYDAVTGVAVRAVDTGQGIVVAGTDLSHGVEHWRAVRYDATGHRDRDVFAAFGPSDIGELLDVVRVGAHLVWLGTDGSLIDRPVIVRTNLDGTGVSQRIFLDPGVWADRLLAHGDSAVWAVGSDPALGAVSAARYLVPVDADPALDPTWSTGVIAGPAATHLFIAGVAEDGGRLVAAGGWDLDGKGRTLLARFAPAGGPDPTFAQNGVLVPDDHNRFARAVVMGPATAPLVLFGIEGTAGREVGYAAAYSNRTDQAPGGTVTYGGDPKPISKVVYHPDPAVDIAMVQIQPIAGTVKVVGVDSAAIGTRPEEKVECYGYGLDAAGHTGTLSHGTFTVVKWTGLVTTAEAVAPTHLQGGDSGGGCLVVADGQWRVRGVAITTRDGTTTDRRGRTVTTQKLVDPTQFADFVASTLAAP